jgi:hypothetical protein
MFSRIGYTWRIMGASFDVLMQDKQLLLFPLFSSISCVLVLASFAVPIWAARAWESEHATQPLYYAVLFVFYVCNYFVITFFNAAIVGSAVLRLSGGQPTFRDGLQAAAARLPQILGWAVLAASVGLVLRIIEDRSERLGRFVAGLLGTAWSIATFLVVPVLVVEQKGPIDALKKSTALLRKTWGDQLVGGAGFGLVSFLLAIPGIVGLFAGFVFGVTIGIVCASLAAVYLILLCLVQSALQTIFEAAVYVYAEKGTAPALFSQELLAGAIVPR